MKCPQCGTANPDANSKCFRCGSVLVELGEAETFAGMSLPPTPAGEQETLAPGSKQVPAAAPGGPLSELPTAGPWAVTGTAAPAPEPVNFGPRYRIERLLGQGGMGAVYQAYDKELDRTVALKLVRPGLAVDALTSQRFKQELLLASKITHKNVLRIHDLGDAGGVKFISMAYVQGQDLHGLLQKEGRLPVERAVRLAKQMCAALAAAHAEGVAHRDFKPQNILLDQNDQVYVSDFGLAKSLEEDTGMTRSGEFLGTPRYMAPEQVEGKKADQRIDLYALGLILYEMVTGDVPFHADTTIQLLYKRVHEQPKSPKTLNPELPDWLVAIIMKCLERDPDRRYQSAEEILRDLEVAQGPKSRQGTVQIALPSVGFQLPRIWLGVLAAVVLIAVLLAVPAVRHGIFGRPRTAKTPPHSLTVLVADFNNYTGDPVFNGTLEPMFNVALEGASFINAFSRGDARRLAEKLPKPTDKLDEQSARLVAVSQGVSAVITGDISLRGNQYSISAMALDAVSGNVLAKSDIQVASKDDVVPAIPKVAAGIRSALGDATPASVQFSQVSGGFTAANLEAVHQDALALDEQFAGKFQEAFNSYSKAVELDPNFARAYFGMAAMAGNLGRPKDAEKYITTAMQHMDRMTERERYRTRGSYFFNTGNWEKCVDEYTQLVSRYPADRIGQLNLAGCLMQLRKVDDAVQAARRAVEIVPKGALQRLDYSFIATFSGDFQTGEKEARTALELNPSSEMGYLILGESQLGQGQLSQAAESYQHLQKLSPRGSSMAAVALADLAVYEGRFTDAARTLEQGAAADLAAKNLDGAADKFAALAYAQLLRGQKAEAAAAADKAQANSKAVKIRFLAGRIFAETGDAGKAQKLASSLGSELQAEPQAYGKIIEGKLALTRGDSRRAIEAISGANKLLDTWIGHWELARAYLEAGLFVEADSELDPCMKRRGEAMELFMDNVPTYGYFPLVYYYQGRARQGLKSPGFAEPYRTYLSIRGQAGEDPLLADIQRRIR